MSDTVCIAAVCVNPDRVFAVLCSDSRIEIPDVASGVIGFKAVSVAPGVIIMYAGAVPRAREIIERYKYHLANPDAKLTHENALDALSVPLHEQQWRDVANFVSAKYGMSYQDYIAKDASSQQLLLYGLSEWRGDAEFIIVWMGDYFVRLFQVNDKVSEQSSFATIGSGGLAAKTSLMSRGFRSQCDLREAVYYIYEAKRNSENVPGVGKETHIQINEFHTLGTNVFYPLTASEIEVLAKQFSRLGPKPFEILGGDSELALSFIPGTRP